MAFKYNKTQFNWDKVKQHLLNQGNISVDIQDLQQDILKAFNKEIKTFGYEIALVMEVLLIMCLCFCIVWRRTIKRQRSQQQQLTFLTISHHVQNQKGGDVGDRKNKRKAGPH